MWCPRVEWDTGGPQAALAAGPGTDHSGPAAQAAGSWLVSVRGCSSSSKPGGAAVVLEASRETR